MLRGSTACTRAPRAACETSSPRLPVSAHGVESVQRAPVYRFDALRTPTTLSLRAGRCRPRHDSRLRLDGGVAQTAHAGLLLALPICTVMPTVQIRRVVCGRAARLSREWITCNRSWSPQSLARTRWCCCALGDDCTSSTCTRGCCVWILADGRCHDGVGMDDHGLTLGACAALARPSACARSAAGARPSHTHRAGEPRSSGWLCAQYMCTCVRGSIVREYAHPAVERIGAAQRTRRASCAVTAAGMRGC